MKNIITIILVFISAIAYSQIEIAPDNEILQRTNKIVISKEIRYDTLRNIGEINNVFQETKETDLNRCVFFLHGLGGTAASWERAAEAVQDAGLNTTGFSARYVRSVRLDYTNSTGTTLNSAASDIRNQIETNTLNTFPEFDPDRTRNFIIAHSQGGLVSRALMHKDFITEYVSPQTRGYGGLVTVSSPLQGAQVLNNTPDILNLANDACISLLPGKIYTNPTTNFISTFLSFIGKDVPEIQQDICDVVSFNVLPYLFKDNTQPITDDYKVGAAMINTLNTDVNNTAYRDMPKVAFYGVEPRENLLWRTVNYLSTNPNTPAAWQANDDWGVFNSTISPEIYSYNERYIHWQNWYSYYRGRYSNYWRVPFLNGYLLYNMVESLKRVVAYKNGIDWFNRANAQWEAVIGIRGYQLLNTVTYYKCKEWKYFPAIPHYPAHYEYVTYNILDPASCCEECTLTGPFIEYKYAWVVKESDGVVLKESSMNLPGATNPPVELKGIQLSNGTWSGSSHYQVRNDDALKKNLHKLFEGNYGDFFKTKTK